MRARYVSAIFLILSLSLLCLILLPAIVGWSSVECPFRRCIRLWKSYKIPKERAKRLIPRAGVFTRDTANWWQRAGGRASQHLLSVPSHSRPPSMPHTRIPIHCCSFQLIVLFSILMLFWFYKTGHLAVWFWLVAACAIVAIAIHEMLLPLWTTNKCHSNSYIF